MVKKMPRIPQSENIPIQTPIGPIPTALIKKVARDTRQSHMEQVLRIIENLTSPAALSPYAGVKENGQNKGFTIVTQPNIYTQRAALSVLMPARAVTGLDIP